MAELDLQDKTRMLDTYKEISEIVERVTKLSVFPSLVWVWCWDICVMLLGDFREDPDYAVTMSDEEVWELFYTQADKNGFSLTYGDEELSEHIRDWMFEQDIITSHEEEEEEE